MQKFINNFEAVLNNSPGVAGTTFQIDAALAGRLGALGAEEYFVLTVSAVGAQNPSYLETEFIKVVAVDTGTGNLTVERQAEGSTAGLDWVAQTTQITATVTRDTLYFMQSGPIKVENFNQPSKVPALTDIGTMLAVTRATGETCQINIPSYATDTTLPTGFRMDFVQRGDGGIQFSTEGTDVIESTGTTNETTAKGSVASLVKLEYDGSFTTWGLYGDIV
jgi:hypothetical protein